MKFGKVVGVEEMETPQEGPRSATPGQKETEAALASEMLGELSLNVRLGVRFEIVN